MNVIENHLQCGLGISASVQTGKAKATGTHPRLRLANVFIDWTAGRLWL
jgi:hypothetical protein